MATKNLLAMTEVTVHSANNGAARTQTRIEGLIANLNRNSTDAFRRIDHAINYSLTAIEARIDRLDVSGSDLIINECRSRSTSVESIAADILVKANSCVSDTVESIGRQLDETYSLIESIPARINSDQNLARTRVAEYEKTEMALRNAIVIARCVNQAKERILSIIKEELLTICKTML